MKSLSIAALLFAAGFVLPADRATAQSLVENRLTVRSTPPGCTVSLDGVVVGTTPLAVFFLPDRTMLVKIERIGLQTMEKNLALGGGRHIILDARLAPEPINELDPTKIGKLRPVKELTIPAFTLPWFVELDREARYFFSGSDAINPAGPSDPTFIYIGLLDMAIGSSLAAKETLFLKDGTKLIGTLDTKALRLHSVFADFQIPVDDLSLLLLGDSSHYFILRGGDKISGTLSDGTLAFTADGIGSFELPASDVRAVIFRR